MQYIPYIQLWPFLNLSGFNPYFKNYSLFFAGLLCYCFIVELLWPWLESSIYDDNVWKTWKLVPLAAAVVRVVAIRLSWACVRFLPSENGPFFTGRNTWYVDLLISHWNNLTKWRENNGECGYGMKLLDKVGLSLPKTLPISPLDLRSGPN